MNPKSQLTTEEAIALFDAAIANINSQFELWITITFAVIIASYIAGHRLSQTLKVGLSVLYVMVSILLAWLTGVSVMLIQKNLTGSLIPVAQLGQPIIILRALVWITGTIVTLGFIFRGFRERDQEESSSETGKP